MKKLVLLTSFLISFLNIGIYNYSILEIESEVYEEESVSLQERQEAIVSIQKNNKLLAMGIIFDIEDNEAYILTSHKVVNENRNLMVVFNNLETNGVEIVGSDARENISLIKTKINNKTNISEMKHSNTHVIKEGQTASMLVIDEERNLLMSKGVVSNKNILVDESYKTIVTTRLNQEYFGTGVYNELGQVIGINVNKATSLNTLPIEGINYVVDINKLLQIANSIKNKGIYQANAFSFDIISLGDLNLKERNYYGVHSSAKSGAIVLSFDPLKYIFGGINQGMAIVQVNGIEVKNAYETHYQINRYPKGNTVNLTLINKSGRKVSYDTKII